MRIVVAMSGGVDSSVAAALLASEGHDVVGLSMQLYDQRAHEAGASAGEPEIRFGSCCTIDDLQDARRVAAALGLPHYIVNFEREFGERVLSNFIEEYTSGRTPIPCVHCNGDLKFAALVERAEGLGAAAVATGHYARVDRADGGRYRLLRGADPAKDQSYFLFTLTQPQLAWARFPVGALTKTEVRAAARELGLRVAEKPDSRELCFVPEGEHAGIVDRLAPELVGAGVITDREGRVLGRHEGTHRFTIGQRKGLGLSTGIPLYVVEIDARDRRVVVGPRAALERSSLSASDVNWISGQTPSGSITASARIRYRHHEATATITPLADDSVRVDFAEPQSAITPGQAVVFYEGEEVLGGGWID
jgi:tRNA-specific 2-thiouridylase